MCYEQYAKEPRDMQDQGYHTVESLPRDSVHARAWRILAAMERNGQLSTDTCTYGLRNVMLN